MSRTIAIVGGTGPIGLALAQRWLRAGESVIIGSRNSARAQAAAENLAAKFPGKGQIRGEENSAAVAAADLVVLTVPFEGHAGMLKTIKDALRPGTVLIDCTVPLAASVGGRPTRVLGVWQGSAAQQAAELVPREVVVAAAFQNVGAQMLAQEGAVDCDIIVCSDDTRAMETACELAEKIAGVRAIRAGKLETSRIVEQITALLISINMRYKVHSAGIRITGLDAGKP